MNIRLEQEEDYKDIKTLNDRTFQGIVEGNIVDNIRASGAECISLVAVEGDEIIGHIFFSPVTVVSGDKEIIGMALGPMAVLPGCQKQGIGSALVKEGVEILKEKGCPFVIVLGHKDYYPRFGFEVASNYGLYPEWEGVPDEAFMVLFLNENMRDKVSGQVRYRHEFNEAV